MAAQTSTKQKRFDGKDARALLTEVDILYSAKGKTVVTVDLRLEIPDWPALARLLLGPTGNLRAPVVRKGRTLVVGFHGETYRRLFT